MNGLVQFLQWYDWNSQFSFSFVLSVTISLNLCLRCAIVTTPHDAHSKNSVPKIVSRREIYSKTIGKDWTRKVLIAPEFFNTHAILTCWIQFDHVHSLFWSLRWFHRLDRMPKIIFIWIWLVELKIDFRPQKILLLPSQPIVQNTSEQLEEYLSIPQPWFHPENW